MKRAKATNAVKRPNAAKASKQGVKASKRGVKASKQGAKATKEAVKKTVTKATERVAKQAAKEAAKSAMKSAMKKAVKKAAKHGPSDWLRRIADLEDACDSITAGRRTDENVTTLGVLDDASRLRSALGRLIELSRRIRGLTPAEFASAHRITMQELVALERGERVTPNPRAIRALAKTAGVAASPCLQLAGCTARVDPALEREAMRFVSATGTETKLTRAEQRRFQAFVKVLSRPA